MGNARKIYKQGFDHFVNGERDEAIRDFREALALDPELTIAWNGLSIALAQANDLDGAIEAARKLTSLEPDDPLSHTNLSRLYQRKGMIDEAEDEMAIASRLEVQKTD
jgi:Flp pilus assembly protein TadD